MIVKRKKQGREEVPAIPGDIPVASATILAHSIWCGREILTYQLEFPRIILSQFNKHATIRSNTSSSRAIPTKRFCEIVEAAGYTPSSSMMVKNEKGMGGVTLLEAAEYRRVVETIASHQKSAVGTAEWLEAFGVHKQHANRYLEPFMRVTVIATGAIEAWKHLLRTRISTDGAVQPEFQKLAHAIDDALLTSRPQTRPWHVPFFVPTTVKPTPDMGDVLYAVGRAARVSYMRETVSDGFKEKLQGLWEAKHLTPFEHVCFYDDALYEGSSLAKGVPLVNPLTIAFALGSNMRDEEGSFVAPFAGDQCYNTDDLSDGWRQLRHVGLGDELTRYLERTDSDTRVTLEDYLRG